MKKNNTLSIIAIVLSVIAIAIGIGRIIVFLLLRG